MKKTLYIKGMHCISCEILLDKQIKELNGVRSVGVSYKSGEITFDIAHENIIAQIEKIILDNGYKIEKNKLESFQSEKNKGWLIIIVATIIFFLFMFGGKINIYQYLPSFDKMNIGVALLMGLVASISTCLAVTGSVILGFAKYVDDSKGWLGHLRVQLSFHGGRILGFFVLGGILGWVGQVFKISISANAIFTIIVGIVLFYMGLHMLGIVPSITRFGFHLPKRLTKNILTAKNPIFAPIIGALTFFLPCGFTQSMQLVAIGSGNFWQGGFIMAMFALGTMPVLLGIGLGGSYMKENKFSIINKIIGILVIIFGVFSINNGWTLFGGLNVVEDNQYMSSDIKQETVKNYEKIKIGHNGWSLEPESVELKAGKNYELIILPSSNGIGCMSTMIIPDISRDVNRIIKGKEIIYKIDGLKSGKYPVVCASMGMYQGEIVVK
ncbi:sulfite exporter TauE/SafE family protein [Candidatus Gracilibacteria bacterium]|nr:sulfite exporter TauE/SafE family protein [Candidatus Gracilibacteria bacterium]